jgi:hypothetical protein
MAAHDQGAVVVDAGSANEVNVIPAGMTTYCRPSTMNVVGGA